LIDLLAQKLGKNDCMDVFALNAPESMIGAVASPFSINVTVAFIPAMLSNDSVPLVSR
jgi:hypothetical protein